MRISLLITIFITLNTYCQNVDNFTVLKSGGKVPQEFNTLSSEKVKEEYKTVSKKDKRIDQLSAKRFILESNYFIDQLLSNGAILYNEDLSQFVSKVADELLENDKELRNNLRFYVIKSPTVNAFATDRGTIFITIGLLAQIENEAQLAYVLSHEIIHYKNKHARTGFVENQRINHSSGKYKRDNWDKALNKSKYAKELELEADVEGLQIFLKSKYSIDEIKTVFDVLQYAHIPIDDIPFDLDFFNDEHFNALANYQKEEIDPIKPIMDEDDDDDYLTHPNINKRRAVMLSELEGESNAGRTEFLYAKDEFFKIQTLARFELSFLFTKQRLYGEAIYNSYILLQSHPNNKFLKTTIAYCLYALAKYKNEGEIHDVITDFDDVQGQSQQVFYLFEEIDKKTLATLAVKYLWDLKLEIKDDSFINTIAEDVLKELLLESGARKLDYKKNFPENLPVASSGLEILDSTNMSKYDKIRKDVENDDDEIKYAFVSLFKNNEFKEMMSKYEKMYVDKVKNGEEEKTKKMSVRKKEKIGRALGIDKVVMVSPNYKKYDLRKEVTEQYVFSERRKEDFISLNEKCAEKAGVQLGMISNTYFESTDKYNDMSLLNDWMDERFGHENIHIYPYCKLYTDELIGKYGTEYFGWTGMYSLRTKKDDWGWVAFSVLYYGIGIPIGIYYALTPENHTFYYTYLVDITNYDFLMVKEDYVKMKDHNDLMKSYIYDSYNQITSKKREKK